MVAYSADFLDGLAVLSQRPYGEDVSIVGISNHTVAIEYSGNRLLGPVAIAQLKIEQDL